mmetsp:Transcript_16141/g.49338  ORF Transcript_16141/g.49338 Transcript_16141/m.49338 type:complete len:206 (+) Transcript_16141:249-866(+)
MHGERESSMNPSHEKDRAEKKVLKTSRKRGVKHPHNAHLHVQTWRRGWQPHLACCPFSSRVVDMVSSLMLFLLLLKAVGDQDKVMSEGGTNGTVDDADLVALIEADLVEGGHHLPGLEGAQRTPIAATRALADGRRPGRFRGLGLGFVFGLGSGSGLGRALIGEHIRVIVDLSLELLERLHAVRAAHKDVRRLGALRREEPSVEG